MRILFDQGVPVPHRAYLAPHSVATAYEKGWSQLRNDNLLDAAEEEKFDVFLTTDQNLQYGAFCITPRKGAIQIETNETYFLNGCGGGNYSMLFYGLNTLVRLAYSRLSTTNR